MQKIDQLEFLKHFREIVANDPAHAAIISGGNEVISYQQLSESAQELAMALQQAGAQAERLIAISIERSAEYIIAMLAVWYADAAFLPLDPLLPEARRAFILEDARPTVLIIREQYRELFNGNNIRLISIDESLKKPLFSQKPAIAQQRSSAQLAYTIYTSGSTGAPKGVMVTHAGIVNFIKAQIEIFQLDSKSRVLLYLSTSFDASISDIGTALLSGATIFIEPIDALKDLNSLIELLKKRAITHIDLPPSLLSVIDIEKMPETLQTIIIGGEVCAPADVRQWAARFRIINVYGPTEATVCASLCLCDANNWQYPAIGSPIANVEFQILDDDLRPVKPGSAGELYISGIGLARGYLNRPDLTAEKFTIIQGERHYRTGDIVIEHADGNIEFLRRADRQFKLRGQLIEPEEIEAVLRSHPAILEAAVVKRRRFADRNNSREMLIAFIVKKPDKEMPDQASLNNYLAAILPEWMRPQRYQIILQLPRTITGKIDLTELKNCRLIDDQNILPADNFISEDAQILLQIWREVLGVEAISQTDNLFELGGNSLAIIEIAARAEARGMALSTTLLLKYPTIGELARYLNHHKFDDKKIEVCEEDKGALDTEFLSKEVTGLSKEFADWTRHSDDYFEIDNKEDSSIFLTGATGFLGTRLLIELLKRTDKQIYCLVRAEDTDAATARLLGGFYCYSDEPVKHPLLHRVTVICGDISKEYFGLAKDLWQTLAAKIATVYHCAAIVNIIESYENLRAANLIGTREVLRLCGHGRRKQLHYASTLSVLVATDRNFGELMESDDLTTVNRVYGGYAQTKWAAEKLVREFANYHRSVSIYRFGLITGDSITGNSAANDLLSTFIKAVATLGALPQEGIENLRVDITPVDYAAATMAQISLIEHENRAAKTYHIANNSSLKLTELIDYLRSFGIEITAISNSEWRAEMFALTNKHNSSTERLSTAYLALCRAFSASEQYQRNRVMDLFQATDVEFNTTNTSRALQNSGLNCPPANEQLLHKYFAAILNSNG